MDFIRQGFKPLPNETCIEIWNGMLKQGNSYYELYYHFVFATKRREPMLNLEKIKQIRQIAKAKADEMGFLLHILNGYRDHIHLLATVPPALSLAQVMKHIKGASSRKVEDVYWQEGYWVKAVEKPHVATVASYIEKQWEHHRMQNGEEWETFLAPQ